MKKKRKTASLGQRKRVQRDTIMELSFKWQIDLCCDTFLRGWGKRNTSSIRYKPLRGKNKCMIAPYQGLRGSGVARAFACSHALQLLLGAPEVLHGCTGYVIHPPCYDPSLGSLWTWMRLKKSPKSTVQAEETTFFFFCSLKNTKWPLWASPDGQDWTWNSLDTSVYMKRSRSVQRIMNWCKCWSF